MKSNRPMSARRIALQQQAEKEAKDAALSAEVEKIMREAAVKVRHLIAHEKKRGRIDPNFFIGDRS